MSTTKVRIQLPADAAARLAAADLTKLSEAIGHKVLSINPVSAWDDLDALRAKLNGARRLCTIYHGNEVKGMVATIEQAITLYDPFLVMGGFNNDTICAHTPVWHPLRPYHWWVEPTR